MLNPLKPEELRWSCDPAVFEFETTDDVEPIDGVVGQEHALEALRFGIESSGPGQNIYIRGLTGTGRMRVVRRLLEELRPECPKLRDICYVHNFAAPDRPRRIELEAEQARVFRRMVNDFADFIRDALPQEIKSDALRARREALESWSNREIEKLTKPFEDSLRAADMALVSIQGGLVPQTAIFPVFEGKPVPPEEFDSLRTQEKVTDTEYALYTKRRDSFSSKLEEITDRVRNVRRQLSRAIHAVIEEVVRAELGELAREILTEYPGEGVQRFLSEIIDDVAENHIGEREDRDRDFTELYRVNVLHWHRSSDECPVITENAPSIQNLLGTVGREIGPGGVGRSDHTMISAGSLLRADGGYLIVEVAELLREPGAWRILMRTLRTCRLDIVPTEMTAPWLPQTLKPDPIELRVKLILIGDAYTYAMLDQNDPDFSNLFKVLADFDSVLPRTTESVREFAGVLAYMAREENWRAIDRTGVAALTEHAARIAARNDRLTARFGRVADLAREASFISKKGPDKPVGRAEIIEAIRRAKHRADLPARRFREYVANGTIKVATSGTAVGEINGLAVLHSGPMTYGFPARITATIGAGTAGVINIEREAALSGAIHTKGFYILGGLLRHLLQTDHPLAFSASIAFEQSYGGIDGDSASGAEICCLLSALIDEPIRQDLAMTGAIDQVGSILAIGGVNEKIEGFFDACNDQGLTGTQGVIIPGSNARDLMLREDVIDACRDGRFCVYTVDRVEQALALLTGVEAGVRDEDGVFGEETCLGRAVQKAYEYWLRAARSPGVGYEEEEEEEEEEEAEDDVAAAPED